ncbi:MAG: hypothetical protein F6K25_09815 [Okeania sp. SIO2G4]|uniref:hypothetical protein n=1 Tax=unclassified Okeania TaxID=2634635 RepID=UPI0013BADDF9|nr:MULTISPECIES: hypothetical protein [unclassified Okeania]NEP03878.1 hypothetical protein [Okeania sp. SIO4D6]NEP72310.1 hypothetical protein [Okeania sp. SIO2G5]NEP94277.1 hypothetical protein [Okeania sp. SIO2F5]NEQ90990.1 hypothetical protein [Okeania sp. SIO2G4]
MMKRKIQGSKVSYNQAKFPKVAKTAQKSYYPRSKKTLQISRITSAPKSRHQRKLSKSQKFSLKSLPWKKWIVEWAGVSLLFGGSGVMAMGAWISVKLISDPNAIVWFNQSLPQWTQFYISGNKSLQTLEQIKGSIKEGGFSTGETFSLPSTTTDSGLDVLVPVMKQIDSRASLPCETPCRELVELRVYQSILSVNQREGSKPYFRLVNTLPLQGPAESFVISSTIESTSAPQGSNQPLPVTTVRRFQGKVPAAGVWFTVSGQRLQNNKAIPYGQIVNYNPKKNYLSSMLEWKSAAGQAPIWQEMTGGGDPELVVEQTVGLDPDFDIYWIQPRKFILNPIELEKISLDEIPIADSYYKDTLRLARNGLWSGAFALIQPLRKNLMDESQWPEKAQAQFDLIKFHAKITEAQAIASWASPSQKVLAGLIDGRWQESLSVFENNLSSTYEIGKLLQNDTGRLRNRVDAALRVNQAETNAIAWGALIVASQKGRRRATSWLNRQPQTSKEAKEKIGKLLDQLDAAFAKKETIQQQRIQRGGLL